MHVGHIGMVVTCALLAVSCAREPYDYPQRDVRAFHRTCPEGEPVCDCTWDKITRTVPPEEYAAALERFRSEGLMDHRIARARTECVERHH